MPGLTLEVTPGSVTFPGGSKSGVVSITTVHSDRVPMTPNFGQQPRLIVTIQPAGARFDPPAKITYPNVEGLAPGESTDLYSFDHDLGHFVSIGPGTVSDDGTMLVSDPGVGILKAGWHCGGDPQSSTGTPHNCSDCHRCVGTACIPESGGSCDDGDPCTVNDSCLVGTCAGQPVLVDEITGACVVGVGQPITLTAVANAPERVKWAAPAGGEPPSGQGESFTVRYDDEGSKVVVGACRANSKAKKITVGPVCEGIEAEIVETEVPGPLPDDAFGRVEHLPPDGEYRACVDSEEWCFRLEQLRSKHTFAINLDGRTNIENASDPAVTAETCEEIIADLTPSITHSQGIPIPPHFEYISESILRFHERFHVQDYRARVLEQVKGDISAHVADSMNCTECQTPTPHEEFDTKLRSLWIERRAEYRLDNEFEAFTASNEQYALLVSEIRKRARSEGWPTGCQ